MVVSIITIVAGITIPSFTGYMTNQSLKNAQDQFRSDLRSVENMALTGSKFDTNVSWKSVNSPARYWIVKWTHAGTSYKSYLLYDFLTEGLINTFEAVCEALDDLVKQTNYNLPSGISFDRSAWPPTSTVSQCTNECLFFNMQDGSTRFASTTGTGCNTNNMDATKIILKNESGSTAPVGWNRNGLIGN